MNVEELKENTEHAQHSGQRVIGLTMAIVAVLLATTTLLGHRTHTEEVLTLTQNVDEWDFYQAKHNRAYQFGLAAETQALLPNGKDAAIKNLRISAEEDCGVPAPKDCASPVLKRSPVLQQLAGQMAAPAVSGKTENTVPHASQPSNAPNKEAAGEKHPEGAKESVSKEGAVQIQEKARESQKEVKVLERKADHYDSAELFLEVSIVLCSISLLTGAKLYWRLSFITTTLGIAVAVWGYFHH
jgi:Domain of unknown function (DUF4337)